MDVEYLIDFSLSEWTSFDKIQDLVPFDNDFSAKWNQSNQDRVSSLTLSGQKTSSGSIKVQFQQKFKPIDLSILDSFDNLGLVTKSQIVRRLLIFFNCIDSAFGALTNFLTLTARFPAPNMSQCETVVNGFISACNSMTISTTKEILQLVHQGRNKWVSGHLSTVQDKAVSDRIAEWILDRYKDGIKTKDIHCLADELSLPQEKISVLIFKRWKRLKSFLEGTSPVPQWLPMYLRERASQLAQLKVEGTQSQH